MNSLPTQAIPVAATVLLAAVAAAALGPTPLAVGFLSVVLACVLALVAFAAQSERLRAEQRLVYRPVYVRRHDVQRRVRSDD